MKKLFFVMTLGSFLCATAFGMGNCQPLTINNCSEGNTTANGQCTCHSVTRSGGGKADCSGILCSNSSASRQTPTGSQSSLNANSVNPGINAGANARTRSSARGENISSPTGSASGN